MANFTLNYNVKGDERKRLVKAIAAHTHTDSEYLGAPTFAYKVGYFTIDKNGCVTFDDRADSEEIEGLIENLYGLGFEAVNTEQETDESEPAENENTAAAENAIDGLVISVPDTALPGAALENLRCIVDAKGNLIKKSLGTDRLEIKVEEHKVSFPWFNGGLSSDECSAYQQFIGALCEFARNAKRVTAKEKEIDNEKFAMRTFLIRLGFIGKEFKTARKVLLRNLEGSSAFRHGKPDKDGDDE